MIQVMFDYAGEKILIIIKGNQVYFGNTAFGSQTATIDGLKLDYKGVCREFPDLETSKYWRQEAIQRFKEKMETLNSETLIMDYLINDLKRFGYVPLYFQREGHRPQKIK